MLCYTAEACFKGNPEWGKRSQSRWRNWGATDPFDALSSCNIVHSESTKERLHFFVLCTFFNHKNRSRHQWRPLVIMTWLFLKLFTVNIHGVQSDPDDQHPRFGSGWKPGGAVSCPALASNECYCLSGWAVSYRSCSFNQSLNTLQI